VYASPDIESNCQLGVPAGWLDRKLKAITAKISSAVI